MSRRAPDHPTWGKGSQRLFRGTPPDGNIFFPAQNRLFENIQGTFIEGLKVVPADRIHLSELVWIMPLLEEKSVLNKPGQMEIESVD